MKDTHRQTEMQTYKPTDGRADGHTNRQRGMQMEEGRTYGKARTVNISETKEEWRKR